MTRIFQPIPYGIIGLSVLVPLEIFSTATRHDNNLENSNFGNINSDIIPT